MQKAWAALLACLVCSVASAIAKADSNFDPDTGLRIHHYTDPVPDTVPGGIVLDTSAVVALLNREPVVLLDVISINDVRYDELDGSWPNPPAREHIEGSLWLPNVGYGKPSDDMLQYLLKQTEAATNNNKDHAVLVYCVSDCWMGWNAVQHLAGAGYRRVYWYPDGTDGWQASGFSLVAAEPTPVDVE